MTYDFRNDGASRLTDWASMAATEAHYVIEFDDSEDIEVSGDYYEQDTYELILPGSGPGGAGWDHSISFFGNDDLVSITLSGGIGPYADLSNLRLGAFSVLDVNNHGLILGSNFYGFQTEFRNVSEIRSRGNVGLSLNFGEGAETGTFFGTNAVETIRVSNGTWTYYLQGGADQFNGGSSEDVLSVYGGGGSDRIEAGLSGQDFIHAGTGEDFVIHRGLGTVSNGGAGLDVLQLDLSAEGPGAGLLLDFSQMQSGGLVSLEGGRIENFEFLAIRQELSGRGDTVILPRDVNPYDPYYLDREPLWDLGNGGDRFRGSEVGERVEGGEGRDTLLGLGGDDTLVAGDGRDLLQGGDGDDHLMSGNWYDADRDAFYGQDGDDFIEVGRMGDRAAGGVGDDLISTGGGGAFGGPGIDTVHLNYTSASQAVQVNFTKLWTEGETKGFYSIEKLASLSDRTGASRLSDYDDSVIIGAAYTGEVAFELEYGNDTYTGGSGSDHVDGGWGMDRIEGGAGDDHLDGGDYYDTDRLFGGDGDDALYGERDDILFGEAGDDVFYVSDPTGFYAGGSGNDFFQIADYYYSEIVIDLKDHSRNRGFEEATFISIEGFSGGSASDSLFGDDADNRFEGNDGDDLLEGRNGDDTLNGGYGNNLLRGGAGNDTLTTSYGDSTLNGGPGDDILVGGQGETVLNGGAGDDTISTGDGAYIARGGGGNDSYLIRENDHFQGWYGGEGTGILETEGFGADRILFDEGIAVEDVSFYWQDEELWFSVEGQYGANSHLVAQVLDASGSDFGSRIESLEFADGTVFDLTGGLDLRVNGQAHGSSGNDRLDGSGAEYESLTASGYAGDDVITGGGYDDTLYGGDGDDTLIGGASGDVLRGEAGNDILEGGDQGDYLFGGAGTDTLNGGAGFDTLSGGDGNDTLNGGDYRDDVYGDAGNDTVLGGAGDDYLWGGTGDDTLGGAIGNDVLRGGLGDDTLIGGAGLDTYVFALGETGSDTVFGFEAGETVWLSSFSYDDASQAASDFVQVSNHVVFTSGDVEVTFRGVQLADVIAGISINGSSAASTGEAAHPALPDTFDLPPLTADADWQLA